MQGPRPSTPDGVPPCEECSVLRAPCRAGCGAAAPAGPSEASPFPSRRLSLQTILVNPDPPCLHECNTLAQCEELSAVCGALPGAGLGQGSRESGSSLDRALVGCGTPRARGGGPAPYSFCLWSGRT